MKTFITLLTTTVLIAGASNAIAYDRQAADDALGYATSVQAVRNITVTAPSQDDIQLQGR
jgi:hypothetical protein